MALINDPQHGGDAYRYVEPEQLNAAAPELLQACLQAYLTLISPADCKDFNTVTKYLRAALR